jgi:RimJ/RimL family protein N-acetyltransferase
MSDNVSMITKRCQLRLLTLDDAPVMFSYRSLPEVYRYEFWQPKTLQEVEEFIRQCCEVIENTPHTWLQYAVCLNDGQMIGDVGIHFMEDDGHVEIGYSIAPKFQGKGYATEAVTALISHIFSDLKKHRITASIDPANIKSAALVLRLGFRKEAHFIKSILFNGTWMDDVIYAILAEEWVKRGLDEYL